MLGVFVMLVIYDLVVVCDWFIWLGYVGLLWRGDLAPPKSSRQVSQVFYG